MASRAVVRGRCGAEFEERPDAGRGLDEREEHHHGGQQPAAHHRREEPELREALLRAASVPKAQSGPLADALYFAFDGLVRGSGSARVFDKRARLLLDRVLPG